MFALNGEHSLGECSLICECSQLSSLGENRKERVRSSVYVGVQTRDLSDACPGNYPQSYKGYIPYSLTICFISAKDYNSESN